MKKEDRLKIYRKYDRLGIGDFVEIKDKEE